MRFEAQWPSSSCGKFDPETAAFAGLRFHTARPAHALHGSRDDGETDASALVNVRGHTSLEDTEDFLMSRSRDTNAFILHPNSHLLRRLLRRKERSVMRRGFTRTEYQRPGACIGRTLGHDLGGNCNLRPGLRLNEFDGVINEVGKNVLQEAFVGANGLERRMDNNRLTNVLGVQREDVFDDRLNLNP